MAYHIAKLLSQHAVTKFSHRELPFNLDNNLTGIRLKVYLKPEVPFAKT